MLFLNYISWKKFKHTLVRFSLVYALLLYGWWRKDTFTIKETLEIATKGSIKPLTYSANDKALPGGNPKDSGRKPVHDGKFKPGRTSFRVFTLLVYP